MQKKQDQQQDLESATPSGPVQDNTSGVNYEVLTMIKTDPEANNFIPCGFLKNGQIRPIYGNSMLGRIKRHHHNHGTHPKLMVSITMYNEDERELKYSLRGVLQNYEVLCQDPSIGMKRQDLFVVLVCDGFDKIPQSFIDYLTERKLLDAKLLRDKGYAYLDEATGRTKMRPIEEFMDQGLDVYPSNLLHTFGACVSDWGIEDDAYFRGRKINFIFALKHNNNGKINSFKWLFQGIAKYLQPEYIQKLDIGTRPGDYSLAKLYKHMEAVPDCGGCCSEVVIDTEPKQGEPFTWSHYWVALLQYYEFKQTIAYFKTFEGWGGFVMALPGCYSMYRYEALRGAPLARFFKLINMEQEPTCWEANEYLVEDRLLSNNVYYQPGAGYKCDFVINAPAYTDCPPTLELLMKQRRRWSNGFLFGELTTILNSHNILGFNGQTHSIVQRLKTLIYLPALIVNKLVGWINPAILLAQLKYMFVFAAYAHFDTPEYKTNHPELWKFFTNDPQSIGFQSVMTLTILFILTVGVIASIGAQLNYMMGYVRTILAFFQIYTLFSVYGTVKMIQNFGIYCKDGINVYVAQFVLQWFVLFCPFIFKPIDAIQNFGKYIGGCFAFYFSFYWWYVIITIYSMCNLDDVTWGNRPTNAAKGLNVVVDNAKRQEILRQNYRASRTNILIWWLLGNVGLMFLFDALVLSAVHNGNAATKATCQSIIKGYACYNCGNQAMVLFFSAIHTFWGNIKLLLFSSFIPNTIYPRKPTSDPESQVLLDVSEGEEDFIPPVIQSKKKAASSKKQKSEIETDEDPSFFSDDLESHQFMQRYKQKGGWTY